VQCGHFLQYGGLGEQEFDNDLDIDGEIICEWSSFTSKGNVKIYWIAISDSFVSFCTLNIHLYS